jgi:glycosyltransferase involved in cell wall biosynthesis/SAM-dependent methyltransferase
MRILLLGPVNTPHVEHLALAVRDRGHDVHVAGYAEAGLPPSPLPERGIPTELMAAPRIPWLRRLLARVRPDVVHAHWLPMATTARLAGARPLVATAWGSDVYLASRLHRLANRWIVRRAERVLADSEALLRSLRDLGAPPERSLLVNWGVDVERFRPADAQERRLLRARLGLDDGPLILHTRSLTKLYNPDVVLAAFAQVGREHPAAQLVLKHIGTEPPDLGPLPPRARIVGHLPYDDLVAYYRAADAFVSIPATDSSPRSAWEALACGVPTVLSDLPWVHELIRDGVHALVVDPRPEPVAAALGRALDDDALRDRLAGEGRRLVERERSEQHELSRLEAIYAAVASEGARRRSRPAVPAAPPVDELARIRAAYDERDASARADAPHYESPAYLTYLQDLEWELLRALGDAGLAIDGAEVLDVGAGSGELLHRLIEFGAARGTGIELMPARVEAGRQRYPTLELVEGNAAELPFAAGSFDVVTQFTCLSSILDPGLRRAVAAEMWRVLRPGGVAISYDLRPAPGPIALAGRLARRWATRHGALWTPVRPLDSAELRTLLPGQVAVDRTVSLNVALPAALRRRRGLALALAAVPALRSHRLMVVRKP